MMQSGVQHPSKAIKDMITQQEAALNHVVDRVELFRTAERELLAENAALQERATELQVGRSVGRSVSINTHTHTHRGQHHRAAPPDAPTHS
jgi:hypothetical protein